jgi:crooked neck
VNYALYAECDAEDTDWARQVYEAVLKLIPHKKFSFAKIWIMFAQFEVRQKNLSAARKILGHAIGVCPKPKIFTEYIELEAQLCEFDRCRTLYAKYLEQDASNCTAWIEFAKLEQSLGEIERARAILEAATTQPLLNMPELLWRAFVEFETEEEEYERARAVYRQLLKRTKHVKVWMSFAQFETTLTTPEFERARKIYKEGFDVLGDMDQKEERLMLLEDWIAFEKEHGDPNTIEAAEAMQPRKILKKRPIHTADGSDAGYEEYYDYIFPDEKGSAPNLKLLEMAQAWKKQKVAE